MFGTKDVIVSRELRFGPSVWTGCYSGDRRISRTISVVCVETKPLRGISINSHDACVIFVQATRPFCGNDPVICKQECLVLDAVTHDCPDCGTSMICKLE